MKLVVMGIGAILGAVGAAAVVKLHDDAGRESVQHRSATPAAVETPVQPSRTAEPPAAATWAVPAPEPSARSPKVEVAPQADRDLRADAEAAFFADTSTQLRDARETRRLVEDTLGRTPHPRIDSRVECRDTLCQIDLECPDGPVCEAEVLRLFGPQREVQLGGAVIVPTREARSNGAVHVVAYLARRGDLPF
jgi:hypothetical protein